MMNDEKAQGTTSELIALMKRLATEVQERLTVVERNDRENKVAIESFRGSLGELTKRFDKFETRVEKNVDDILHSNKATESSINSINLKFATMTGENTGEKLKQVEDRLGKLERYYWYLMGAVALAIFLLNYFKK